VRSYTVVYLFHQRWERALFFSAQDADQYAATVQRWPGVSKLYVVSK